MPSPSPTLRSAARATGPQRPRPLSHSGANTPGSGRRANDILYIRVRRREGENVLHRVASNNVDNFSVDNPLWITAAAGGRLLRGGRRRPCRGSVNADGGSVNAGTEVQTRTGRVRKPSRAMGTRRRRLSAPWLRFHGANRVDVYIIIRVRACCCGECALNPPTSQPIPRRSPSLAPAQRHALPEHFRSPTQCRRTPAGCAMHARRPHNPFSAEDFLSPPHSDTPFPSTSAPHAAPMHARRPHNPFPAECLRSPPHSDTPFPSTSARPRSADAHPQTARCIPRRPHHPFPAAPRCLSFRSASGTKKTAPHSECAMPNVSVDRRAVGHLGW